MQIYWRKFHENKFHPIKFSYKAFEMKYIFQSKTFKNFV